MIEFLPLDPDIHKDDFTQMNIEYRACVRGYRYHDRETPFREGYMITWVDQDLPRERAQNERRSSSLG